MAKVGLDAIGKSTPLESNKSQPTLRQSYHAPSGHHEACKWSPQGGNLQGSLCAPPLACVTRLASMHSSKGNIVLLDRRPIALLPSPCGAGTRALQAILPPPRHEVNPVGQDLVLAPFLAVLPVPTAPLQAPFNERGTTFPEILTRGFRLAPERDHIDKADVFPPLTRAVLPPTLGATLPSPWCIHGQTEGRHRGPTGRRAQFRITRQIAE